jgi:uncharacterized membrane protein
MITFQNLLSNLILASALGCGIIGGVFFAFSTFVMKALARIPANEGIAAMQSINIVVVKSWFLAAFLGTAIACAFVVIWAVRQWGEPSSVYLIAGGLLYIAGTFAVTMIFNVPMNNALASLSPTDPDSAARWASYVSDWTMWNHVRTAAALAGSALLVLGRS